MGVLSVASGQSAAFDAEHLARLGRGQRGSLHQRRQLRGARPTSSSLCWTAWPRAYTRLSSIPTRRWPPAASAAAAIGRCAAPDPGGRPAGDLRRQQRDPGEQRGRRPGHTPGNPGHEVHVHLAPEGQPLLVEQPPQRARRGRGRTARTRGRPHARCSGGTASTMNGHGLRNTSSPKFVVPQVSEQESGSASSTVSRWSSGSCTDAAGRQLDDQVGGPPDGLDRRAQQPRVEGRSVLGVPDVQVDHRRAGRLAAHRGLDELVQRGRQLRDVGLARLGAGRRDGDEGVHGP